jgi:S-adenosylmethionine decarboxylase
MHKLVEPTVLEVGELSPKDPGGITGFVLIAESHISIHTFPRRGFLSADVYTCQGTLKEQWIRNFFARSFGLKDIETNYLIRGSYYPQSNIA